MSDPIQKGSIIRLRTTNGGRMIAALGQTYEPNHSSATIDLGNGHYFDIWHARIKSIEPAPFCRDSLFPSNGAKS